MSEQDNQVVDTTSSNEPQELEINLDDVADTEGVEAQPKTYSEEQFKQVLARAKKAEAALKANKPEVKPQQQNQVNSSPQDESTIEKKILLSQDFPEDLLADLEALAKVRGKSLIETKKDPVFIKIMEDREAKKKSEKAALGTSSRSSTVKKQVTITTPNLTSEDHKRMWEESMGK